MDGKSKPASQNLLAWREQQENLALQNYGQALKTQDQAVGQLEAVLQDLQETRVLLEIRFRSGASSDELSRLRHQCDCLETQRLVCEYAVKATRNQARLAFTRLLAARYTSALVFTWKDHLSGDSPQPFPSPEGSWQLPPPKQSLAGWITQDAQQTLWN